jgi:hypothetical protein
MLDDPRATYLPSFQKFQNFNGWDIAVKTGTENQEYNGVMTAWNTQYAVIGFAGYHTLDKPLEEGHFEDITEPISRTWIEQALTALHTKPINWTAPSNVKTLPGYVQTVSTGFGAEVPGPTNDLYPSWYVGGGSTKKTTSQTIDKVSGLVATTCTPPLAREVLGGGGSTSNWNVDIFKGGVPNIGTATSTSVNSSSTASTDDVHNCNDSPPTVTLTAPQNCPSNGCVITATVTQGTHSLTDPQYPEFPGNVLITLNGNKIYSADVSNSPSTVSFTYIPTSTGSGVVKATVTDSVLYQGTASSTMSYSAPSAITASATAIGTSATVNWTGGNGTFTVTLNNQGTSCTTSGCTVGPLNVGNNAIVVSDSDGDSPSTVNISGP